MKEMGSRLTLALSTAVHFRCIEGADSIFECDLEDLLRLSSVDSASAMMGVGDEGESAVVLEQEKLDAELRLICGSPVRQPAPEGEFADS